MNKIAFVAALQREVRPLVQRWRCVERQHDGFGYKFFENDAKVVVCAGIGREAARRTTEAAIALYSPGAVWSVGFAGGLKPGVRVGDVLQPARVVDASDGSSIETSGGEGTLISFSSIAGVQQKQKLGRAYGADAVDMEAAAVARGAQARGVQFSAYKVISDDSDFEIPGMEHFIRNGKFRSLAFVRHCMIRPWLWPRLIRLGRNSSRAAEVLCHWLLRYTAESESLENKPAGLHPMKRA